MLSLMHTKVKPGSPPRPGTSPTRASSSEEDVWKFSPAVQYCALRFLLTHKRFTVTPSVCQFSVTLVHQKPQVSCFCAATAYSKSVGKVPKLRGQRCHICPYGCRSETSPPSMTG